VNKAENLLLQGRALKMEDALSLVGESEAAFEIRSSQN
jgi:hypothetical protein